MAFLIDADVIIQAERKALDLEPGCSSHPDEEIKLAAITVAELWRSVERATGARRTRRQNFCNRRSLSLRLFRTAKRRLSNMRACGQTLSPPARG